MQVRIYQPPQWGPRQKNLEWLQPTQTTNEGSFGVATVSVAVAASTSFLWKLCCMVDKIHLQSSILQRRSRRTTSIQSGMRLVVYSSQCEGLTKYGYYLIFSIWDRDGAQKEFIAGAPIPIPCTRHGYRSISLCLMPTTGALDCMHTPCS